MTYYPFVLPCIDGLNASYVPRTLGIALRTMGRFLMLWPDIQFGRITSDVVRGMSVTQWAHSYLNAKYVIPLKPRFTLLEKK